MMKLSKADELSVSLGCFSADPALAGLHLFDFIEKSFFECSHCVVTITKSSEVEA